MHRIWHGLARIFRPPRIRVRQCDLNIARRSNPMAQLWCTVQSFDLLIMVYPMVAHGPDLLLRQPVPVLIDDGEKRDDH